MSRILDILASRARSRCLRGTWSEDVYTQCNRTIARYSYEIGTGEMLRTADEARADAASELKRAGYTIELPLASRDVLVVGEADGTILDREAYIRKARADRIQIEASRDVSSLPSAKGPNGPERRAAAEQMEREADAWARALDPRKRTGVHKALTARIEKGEDLVRCSVYLAALVRISQVDKRWVEPVEPANDRAAA